MTRKFSVKNMALIAILSAVAYLLVCLIRIPIIPAAPFLQYEPKDVVIAICGFLLGPAAALISGILVAFVEFFTISTTGVIGLVMNVLSTCSYACTAAIIYKKKHSLSGAVLGLVFATIAMAAVMLLWNYLITPLYMAGTSRSDIAKMLVPIFLPFNLLKAGLNSALILFLYKPLVTGLRKANLLPGSSAQSSRSLLGICLLGLGLALVLVLVLLILNGTI